MWQKVTGRIIRQGRKFWSVEDFNPTQDEIRTIIDISNCGLVHICRADKNILVFRDNKFVSEGPFFPSGDMPQFATDKDAEYIFWMKILGEFSVDELAEVRYPEVYMRGQAFRLSAAPNVWAPQRKELEELHPGERIEAYDYHKLARIRVGNFVYVKARNEGWVTPTEYGKWKYIGKRRRY